MINDICRNLTTKLGMVGVTLEEMKNFMLWMVGIQNWWDGWLILAKRRKDLTNRRREVREGEMNDNQMIKSIVTVLQWKQRRKRIMRRAQEKSLKSESRKTNQVKRRVGGK